MINKCKINGDEVLFFGEEKDLNFPEYLKIETLEKNVGITSENENLPILSAAELRTRIVTHKRTRDIKLSEAGIESYADLKASHFLIQYKKLNASKSIRDLVEEKYAELVEYDNPLTEATDESNG